LGRLWQDSHHRGIKNARSNGHDANAMGSKLAGDRQGHAGDPGLGGRVRGLADLAFEGGDRSSVNDHTPFALGIRRVLYHEASCEAYDIERPDQVDLDDTLKALQGYWSLPANDPFRSGDPGTIDHNVETAKPLLHLGQGALNIPTLGDVHLNKKPV